MRLPPNRSTRPLPRLELRPSDRVVLVGNTLADRQQYFNHFETTLLALYPQLELSMRNLGWSADTLTLQPRPLNFGDATQHLTTYKADVILAFFGANESFEGEAGIPQFEKDLEAYIAKHRAAKYNGEEAPRLAFVSPIAHERLERLVHVDVEARNRELARYTEAMRRVTARLGVPFADVFTPMREAMASAARPLTVNGMHLNEEGDKVFAVVLITALGLAPEELPAGSKSYTDLRTLIAREEPPVLPPLASPQRRVRRRAPRRPVRVGELPAGDEAARRVDCGAGEEDLAPGPHRHAAPRVQADAADRVGRLARPAGGTVMALAGYRLQAAGYLAGVAVLDRGDPRDRAGRRSGRAQSRRRARSRLAGPEGRARAHQGRRRLRGQPLCLGGRVPRPRQAAADDLRHAGPSVGADLADATRMRCPTRSRTTS